MRRRAESPRFVGGHPICGSEARGAEHASRRLFEGATWFLTPTAQTDPERHRLVHGFVAELGAVPVAIDPAAHDRLVALTSHLPHVLANVVVNQAGAARVEGHEPLASGGRLAARHDPRRRREPAHLGRHLPRQRRRGRRGARRAPAPDRAGRGRARRGATRASSPAGSARRRATGGGCSTARTPTPARCTACACTCPTGPGVLAAITQALGAERINIEDFELQHISPERGGTLTLLVTGEGEAARAAELLESQGYGVARLGARVRIEPAGMLVGAIAVPGDKSISHRALLIGALCEGETLVRSWGRSGDTESTLGAVRALGVQVDERLETGLRIEGVGCTACGRPRAIDCGNAGTLMRLLAGILAGQEGRFELVGDESLSRRPMERIAEPLARDGRPRRADGCLPLVIEGRRAARDRLRAAGRERAGEVGDPARRARRADGKTTVVEPAPTRDHTELMLRGAGANVVRRPRSVTLDPPSGSRLGEVDVPGDISSAAPFIVAATLLPGSELIVARRRPQPAPDGPARRARADGRADRRLQPAPRRAASSIGDVEVRSAELVATTIAPEEVPPLVDELPLFALAAAVAHGKSEVRGAEELRVKESDRIETVSTRCGRLGVRIEEREDGFAVSGVPTRPRGGGYRLLRRPPDRDARRDCRARLARGRRARGAGGGRCKLPRVLRRSWSR